MNDVERLAEALRRANAELEVDPNELTDTVQHAHRRLLGRLLVVAVLSAVGTLLLLSGGLVASKAVKDNGTDRSGADKADKSPGKPHQSSGGEHGGKGSNPSGSHKESGGGSGHHAQSKQQAQASISSGQSTKPTGKPKPETQPNLRVVSLTPAGIEVINEGDKLAKSFAVVITVDSATGEPLGEPFTVPFEALGPHEEEAKTFAEALSCEESGFIVAEIDPEKKIEESEEDDNKGESERCEPTESAGEKSKEGSRSEGKSTTPTTPAATNSPSWSEP